jgi:serine/threonine-protein kinase RsbW
MTRSVDLLIHNDLAEIAVVRDTLDQLGSELGVPARALMQLQVAADEIISNVVKYSWADGRKHEFLVRITVNDIGVMLDIFDDGEPFDPRGAPEPNPPPAGKRPSPGGVGIHMVRKLVDDFAYERVDGRNHTSLIKKCATSAVARENDR